MNCPNCNAENYEEHTKCAECGAIDGVYAKRQTSKYKKITTPLEETNVSRDNVKKEDASISIEESTAIENSSTNDDSKEDAFKESMSLSAILEKQKENVRSNNAKSDSSKEQIDVTQKEFSPQIVGAKRVTQQKVQNRPSIQKDQITNFIQKSELYKNETLLNEYFNSSNFYKDTEPFFADEVDEKQTKLIIITVAVILGAIASVAFFINYF